MRSVLNWDELKKEFITPQTQKYENEIVSSGYTIVFEESNKYTKDWYITPPNTFIKQTEISIVRPIDSTNKAAFTHELLHAYLFTQGFRPLNTRETFDHFFKKNTNFKSAFYGSQPDRSIYNAIQHAKMIPLFTKAGYHKDDFRTDSDMPVCLQTEYKSLQNKNTYQDYFMNFIKFYSRVNDCPAEKQLADYTNYANKLKCLDKELYGIFCSHWNLWILQDNFEFENIFISLLKIFEKAICEQNIIPPQQHNAITLLD